MNIQDPYANAAPPSGGGAPMPQGMPMMPGMMPGMMQGQGQDQDAMKRQMLAQMLRGGGNGYQQLGNNMGSLLGMLMAQKGQQMPMANGSPMPVAPQPTPQVGPGTGGMY